MFMASNLNNTDNVDGRLPTVWHVGGEDVRLRIPLLVALRDRNFNVGAVGSEDGGVFADYQIPYFRYSLTRGINPFTDLKTRHQFFQLCRQHKPDIVHGFDTKPAMIAPTIAKKAGIVGRVRTITGMGYVFSSNSPLALVIRPIYRYLQRQASRATGITIFQNSDDRDYFHQYNMVESGRDALVLGSGIDVDGIIKKIPTPEILDKTKRELGLEGKMVVTMISRLVISKGVREFLQAAKIVGSQLDNVVFLLVGPLASEGKQAITSQELENYTEYVRYLGSRNDIPTILSLTDLFVLPSYYREGIPRVLLEAGAMSLPLISTDMPGCREVVKDGWNGLVVPPRNAKTLASKILELLYSQDLRKLMGQRSKDHINENFTLTQVADAYADIYSQVLRG